MLMLAEKIFKALKESMVPLNGPDMLPVPVMLPVAVPEGDVVIVIVPLKSPIDVLLPVNVTSKLELGDGFPLKLKVKLMQLLNTLSERQYLPPS